MVWGRGWCRSGGSGAELGWNSLHFPGHYLKCWTPPTHTHNLLHPLLVSNFAMINFLLLIDTAFTEQTSPFFAVCSSMAMQEAWNPLMERIAGPCPPFHSPFSLLPSVLFHWGCCELAGYVTSYRRLLFKSLIGDSPDDKQASVCQVNIPKHLHLLLFSFL